MARSAIADDLGTWCQCGRPARKARDCPDAALECVRCGPIRRVER